MDHNVINVRQSKILSNIMAYLGTNHRDDTFIKQFEPGYCQGIATLWLYSKWLETQPNPNQKNRDDYKWFQSTIMLIADWDQKRKLTQKEEFEFERFISLIEIFQHPEHYLPSRPHSLEQYFEDTISGREKDLKSLKEMEEILTQQLNEPNLLKEKKTILETKLRDLKTAIKVREGIQKQEEEKKYNPDENRQLKKEYAIGALFTLDQLKQLLKTDNLIQDGKLILIISHNHATALLRNGNNYIFFDPNYETGEITVGSPDKVAELIFNANGFENNKPSPLGFMMFSFTDIPTKKYPSPKMVLDSINPLSTIPETGYGHAMSPLMVAAIIGSAETAIYFLEKGVNPVLQDKDGWTAATIAAEKGHANIIESLHKINPNLLREPDKNGWTAATIAAENGHANIIELLNKINPMLLMEPNKNGWTAATMATVNGQANIIELLHKINPNLLMEPDKNGWTTATVAAEKGHANIIELLNKINPMLLREPDKNDWTAATVAAGHGQANIIESLHKIDHDLLREPNKNGWTAATMAAVNGQANIIELLHKINPNLLMEPDTNGWTAATTAAEKGHANVIELLYKINPNFLSEPNRNGNTVATIAAANGQANIIELLNKINPMLLREPNKNGWTAATVAAEKGHANIIELLNKINPNLLMEPNKNGWTAATMAAVNGQANVIELLNKINPMLFREPDKNGWTAATTAAKYGRANVIELLNNINPKLLMESDNSGWTAATTAAKYGRANVIELLNNINPKLLMESDNGGWTAATKAAANGHANVIELLYKVNPDLLRKPDKNGWTAATRAAANGRANIIAELLNNKIIDINDPFDILQIFDYAVKNNHLDVAKLLFVLAKKAFARQKKFSVFLALAAIVFSVIIMLYPPNILVPLIPITVSAMSVIFIIGIGVKWFHNAYNINKIEVEIGIDKKNEINQEEEKINPLEKIIQPVEVEEKIHTSTTIPKKESTDIPVIPKVVLTTKQPEIPATPVENKKI